MGNDEKKDNLDTILYGKSDILKLADGKDYEFREPSLYTLKQEGINLSEIASVPIEKLAYIMFTPANPKINEDGFYKLVTFSIISNKDFLSKLFSLVGVEIDTQDSKKK